MADRIVPAFREAGRGDRVILFLHGIGGNRHAFDDQLGAVAASGYHAVAWDLPGYGDSLAPAKLTFAALSEAVHALLDALQVSKAVILGHSFGGMIAQEFAARHPDRVAGLVLFATTAAFGGRDDKFKQDFLAARLRPLDEGMTPADIAPKLVGGMFSEATPQTVKDRAVASMAAISSDAYRASLECIVTFDRKDDLARIAAPTLVLAAELDTLAPPKTMESMARRIPGARYVCLQGVGHLANFEDPEQFNRVLLDFVGTID